MSKSKYRLNELHNLTAAGYVVRVVDSFQNGAIRLAYRKRPDGLIAGWQVEGPRLSCPELFKTEEQARDFIGERWNINPHTKPYGLDLV